MASVGPRSIDVLLPQAYPQPTNVKTSAANVATTEAVATNVMCPTGLICVRALIVDENTGDAPDSAVAAIFHSDPGTTPGNPPAGAAQGQIGDFGSYNARWDQNGGQPVTGVYCNEVPAQDNNWLVIWAKWTPTGNWEEYQVTRIKGVCSSGTDCAP